MLYVFIMYNLYELSQAPKNLNYKKDSQANSIIHSKLKTRYCISFSEHVFRSCFLLIFTFKLENVSAGGVCMCGVCGVCCMVYVCVSMCMIIDHRSTIYSVIVLVVS